MEVVCVMNLCVDWCSWLLVNLLHSDCRVLFLILFGWISDVVIVLCKFGGYSRLGDSG